MTPSTLLVVEDERAVRDLLVAVLRREGFTVYAAASAEEAVELELPRAADCLVTDVMLPGMNGPELARTLRGRWPAVRVIFMSGYAGALLTEEEMAGAEFIQKPFDARVVARKVRSVLNPAAD